MTDIQTEPHIDAIRMPENLKIGMMVSEHRKACQNISCNFDYYGFAFGQSPFHIPPPLAQALKDNAEKGHYSAAEGIPELRRAISGFNKRHFDLDIDPSRIIAGPGTKQLIHIIFDTIKGDVIIPSPSWIGYSPQIKLLDKHFHTFYLNPEHNYKIQAEDLDKYLSGLHRKQHILVLNNPHNPTGALYTRHELESITEICRRHSTIILADEIYALTTYEIEKFTSMAKIYPEGTFTTNGLSKDKSAGGYRLGYCILPENCTEKLKEDFKKVAATVYTNVSTPTQYAATLSFEPNGQIEEYFRTTREIHRIIGNFTSEQFNSIDNIKATTPQGSFYFFADFNELKDDLIRNGVKTSNELMYSLISHPHHIATITGDACMLKPDNFGARIAFVDYNGKEAYENFIQNPPKTKSEETEFAKQNAPRIERGIEALKRYVNHIRAH